MAALLFTGCAALLWVVPGQANNITFTPGTFSPQQGAVNTDFESGTPPGWTFSGSSGITNVSVVGSHLEPYTDTTNYAYVGAPGGSITGTFSAPFDYLGVYWGSPDTYNVIVFTDSMGMQTTYQAGTPPLQETGLPVPVLSQYVNFFDTGAPWVSVTFLSKFNAFEFDNVAVITLPSNLTGVPEPAAFVPLGFGLMLLWRRLRPSRDRSV